MSFHTVLKALGAALLLVLTFSSYAQVNNPPTDLELGLPAEVVIQPGSDLIVVDAPFGVGVPAGDDTTSNQNVSAVFDSNFNVMGTFYNANGEFYVGSNGYVSFFSTTTISPSIQGGSTAPLFILHRGDWDPGNTPVGTSPGGNSTGTNDIFLHLDPINDIVTVTFDDIDDFTSGDPGSDTPTAAQIRFHDISGGDFVAEYRYEAIGFWAINDSRKLGWSAGDLIHYDESNIVTPDFATKSNIGQGGVYAWLFVDGFGSAPGTVREIDIGGVAGALRVTDPDPGDTFTFEIIAGNDEGIFDLYTKNGVTYIQLVDNLGLELEEQYVLRIRVTDFAGNQLEKDVTAAIIKAPTLLTASELTGTVGETFRETIRVATPGNSSPTIQVVDIPAWMTLSDNGDGTAVVEGFAPFELRFSVTINVIDGLNAVEQITFYVDVKEPETKASGSNSDNQTTTNTTEETVTSSGGGGGSLGGFWLLLLSGIIVYRSRFRS